MGRELLAAIGCLSLCLLPSQGSARGGAPREASVEIQRTSPGRVVPEALFGSNLQWVESGDGALVDGQWAEGLLDALDGLGVHNLRFPGGALANTYRWRDGTGPQSERPPGLDFAGNEAPSTFGSDELIQLCQAAGLRSVVTANVSAGPEEAAEWVEYLNGDASTAGGALRTQHGMPEPLGVTYWELGNELYNPDTPGHLSATEYGSLVPELVQAMKARDPSIKVGAHLEVSLLQAAWVSEVLPELQAWNEEVLEASGDDIEFVSVHFYAPFDQLEDEDRLRELLWAGSDVLRQNLAIVRELLERHAGPSWEIALTEYNAFFGDAPDPRIARTDSALFAALLLMVGMREPDVSVANHWSLLNNGDFGMLYTDAQGSVVPRPMYAVMEGMATMAGGALLPTQVVSPTYSVEAKGNIPALSEVAMLDAVAVRRADGTLQAALVNRSATFPLRVTLRLDHPDPRSFTVRVLSPADAEGTQWAETNTAPGGPPSAPRFTLPPRSLGFLEEPP